MTEVFHMEWIVPIKAYLVVYRQVIEYNHANRVLSQANQIFRRA